METLSQAKAFRCIGGELFELLARLKQEGWRLEVLERGRTNAEWVVKCRRAELRQVELPL